MKMGIHEDIVQGNATHITVNPSIMFHRFCSKIIDFLKESIEKHIWTSPTFKQ
jgi:hypothetical protein